MEHTKNKAQEKMFWKLELEKKPRRKESTWKTLGRWTRGV
jgi:hypothetical protein